MKPLWKTTWSYLKQSRFYSISVLIATTLSILLVSGCIILYNNHSQRMAVQSTRYGTWVLQDYMDDLNPFKGIEEDPAIEITQRFAIYDYGVFEIGRQAFVDIVAYSEFNDLKPVTLLNGTYQKNDQEILVSEDFVNAYAYKIGDSFTKTIGNRYSNDEQNINQKPLYQEESFVKREDKTFKITGIYDNSGEIDTTTPIKDQMITKSSKKSSNQHIYYAINKVSEETWNQSIVPMISNCPMIFLLRL